MKRSYKLEGLDCAVCAAKMERAVRKVDGVRGAAVSFLAGRLTVEADDGAFDEVMEKVVHTCRRVEPGCTVVH